MPITPTSTLSKNYQALGIDEIANDIETVFTSVNALEITVNALEPTYKVYTALLTQTGTNAPVATVLENTLGLTPQWLYDVEGSYYLDNSIFILGKTIVFISTPTDILNVLIAGSASANVFINSYASGVNSNGILLNTSIEIRVYN